MIPPSCTPSFDPGWYGYVSKDLRTELGMKVRGPFSRRYCGNGSLKACRTSLWAAIQAAAVQLSATEGPNPSDWYSSATAERITFIPGLIPFTHALDQPLYVPAGDRVHGTRHTLIESRSNGALRRGGG